MKSGSDLLPGIIPLMLCIICMCPIHPVWGDSITGDSPQGIIRFHLIHQDDANIEQVSLMKSGEFTRDGRAHQLENVTYLRDSEIILWNPCNEYDCVYSSFPTSGGNSGRDELILTITTRNPGVDTSSCFGDETCKRLKGEVNTISGVLNGSFHTGRDYEVYLSSLKPGVGESFTVREVGYHQ
jgi:hypothetical protein